MDTRSVPHVCNWLFLSKFSCANTVSHLCRNHNAMMLRFIRVFVFTVLFLQNLPLLPASVGSERDFWESGMGCTVEIPDWMHVPKLSISLTPFLKFQFSNNYSGNTLVVMTLQFWFWKMIPRNTIPGWTMITLSSCQSWNWCYWICNYGKSSITWTCINLQYSTNVNVKVNTNNESLSWLKCLKHSKLGLTVKEQGKESVTPKWDTTPVCVVIMWILAWKTEIKIFDTLGWQLDRTPLFQEFKSSTVRFICINGANQGQISESYFLGF